MTNLAGLAATVVTQTENLLLDSANIETDGGVAWPVVIIGGLVIIAGLVAVRSEFRNWRERRKSR